MAVPREFSRQVMEAPEGALQQVTVLGAAL
jgi:hypothetical protein